MALPLLALSLVLGCGSDTKLGRIPSPPTARITGPEVDAIWRQEGDLVTLTGVVGDDFDSPDSMTVWWEIGELEVSASADAAGDVATEIDPDLFAPGPQVVRLAVLDTDGDYGDDVLEYTLWGPLGAPAVTITAPADASAFDVGETITFQGTATDTWTDPDDLVFAWSSDLEGPLDGEISADGETVLVSSLSTEGTHMVTLTVTDTDGEIGTDTISVVIGEEVELPPDEPEDAEPGDLVFSEMMINPQAVADEVGEWVELYNTSGSRIEIAGYTFRDDDFDFWVLEGSMVVEPHDYFVLCADLSTAINGGVPCDGWFLRDPDTPGLALANAPDEVVLMRPDSVEIDWLHYDDEWYTPGVALGLDPRYLDAGDNDDKSRWCDQTTVVTTSGEPGTPGFENDPC
ncbi:MAG: lamin tail domain-containing protein [Alphaproteobacteria bacterium]|nr:lamin tail domain-containing protein [Alphaproteobacteria bacterium]